jgi:heme-degrading monooxygenase HmoA
MVYSVHLYVVNPRRGPFFISSMRSRGLYYELARRTLPGFMGIDLLRNHQDASEFLCLTFWTSLDKYAAAQSSSNYAVLAHFLEKLTITGAHLGTFSFPAPERLIPIFPGAGLKEPSEQILPEVGRLPLDPSRFHGGEEPSCSS